MVDDATGAGDSRPPGVAAHPDAQLGEVGGATRAGASFAGASSARSGGQYLLAMLFPTMERARFPVTRDQAMLLMAATNEIFLGIDIFFAHQISGSIVGDEWIPIIFGPVAGALLLAAGLVARRRRDIATVFANVVFVASIVVGLLGAYFHLRYALLPSAPMGERANVDLLVWAPPILGPLTFCLVGLVGLSAAWLEDPPDSGALVLLRGWRLRLPYSKTRAYLFMVGMGSLATVISSVLDHARTGFQDPRLWLPTAVGVFATVVSIGLGALDRPTRRDLRVYFVAMLLMIAVGLGGAWLHVSTDLGTTGTVVLERFIRGAPFMAPLLFADIGAIGLLALMAPTEVGAAGPGAHR
ncbi:MAG: hypothetical protein P8099_08780 [Gemmatimonadota bacterium]